jgi:hypothetical protein
MGDHQVPGPRLEGLLQVSPGSGTAVPVILSPRKARVTVGSPRRQSNHAPANPLELGKSSRVEVRIHTDCRHLLSSPPSISLSFPLPSP